MGRSGGVEGVRGWGWSVGVWTSSLLCVLAGCGGLLAVLVVVCVVAVEGHNKEIEYDVDGGGQRERTMIIVSPTRNVYCLALDQNLTLPG